MFRYKVKCSHIFCFFSGRHELGLQKYKVSEEIIQEEKKIYEELQLHFTFDIHTYISCMIQGGDRMCLFLFLVKLPLLSFCLNLAV